MRLSFKFLIIAGLSMQTACSTTAEGRKQLAFVSKTRVDREGARTFERIKNRNVLDEKAEDLAYVNCVVSALKPGSPEQAGKSDWEIVILKNNEANAFALPGRKIAVNSGLLRVAVNEDQLAAVLAHEMSHVDAEHGLERTSQQVALESVGLIAGIVGKVSRAPAQLVLAMPLQAVGGVVQLGLLYPFSRIQEEEADLMGLELMKRAGFAPVEALHFWRNMEEYGAASDDGALSTHPSHQARMAALEQRLKDRGWDSLQPASVERTHCEWDSQ